MTGCAAREEASGGSCGCHPGGMDWGRQGFKIRQDDTFVVLSQSEFSGWKMGYGPDCDCDGGCGGACTSGRHSGFAEDRQASEVKSLDDSEYGTDWDTVWSRGVPSTWGLGADSSEDGGHPPHEKCVPAYCEADGSYGYMLGDGLFGTVICKDPLCRKCRPCFSIPVPTVQTDGCPFSFEQAQCSRAIDAVKRAPKEECRKARSVAISACHHYDKQRMALSPRLRALCPRIDIPMCEMPLDQCCLSVVCRDLDGATGLLFTHCAILKQDCNGDKTLFEMLKAKNPGFGPHTQHGKYLFAIPITGENEPYLKRYWTYKTKCWDCDGQSQGGKNGESSPCGRMSERALDDYELKDYYGIPIGTKQEHLLLLGAATFGVGLIIFDEKGQNSNTFAKDTWADMTGEWLPAPTSGSWGWGY